MTQHTMNFLLGALMGWSMRGLYILIKAKVAAKIASKGKTKRTWLDRTPDEIVEAYMNNIKGKQNDDFKQ
jgi:hypothetical protein